MPGIIDTHSHMAIQGGVNEISLVDRPRGPGQGRGHRRRPGALSGPGRRDDHGAAPPRLGRHDRRPGRRDQAPPRPAGRELIVKADARRGSSSRSARTSPGRRAASRTPGWASRRRSSGPSRRPRPTASSGRRTSAAKAARATAGPPPRRDLRLEALAGILDGSIKIHCHCYRQDEILMLLNVAHAARRPGPVAPARPRRLQGRPRDRRPRRQRLDLLRLVGLQGRGVRRHPLQRRAPDPGRRPRLHQERQRGAGPPPQPRSGQDRQVRRRDRDPGAGDDHDQPGARAGPRGRLGSIEVGKDADIALFNAPSLRRLRPVRAGPDRRRGLVPARRRRTTGLRPARATTRRCPARARLPGPGSSDLRAAAEGAYALVGATLHPVSGPDIANGTLVDRRRQDRRDRRRRDRDPRRRPDASTCTGSTSGPAWSTRARRSA